MKIRISLSKAKWLGIIGSALTLFLYIPNFGGILNLVGVFLLLFALKSIARHTHTPHIFRFFAIYLVLLLAIAVFRIATAPYIIAAIEDESITTYIKVLEALPTILPVFAVYFFAKSYTLVFKQTDIRWFWATGKTNFAIALLLALIGLLFIFTEGNQILGSLSSILTGLSIFLVPILGIVSFSLMKPSLLSYRYRQD